MTIGIHIRELTRLDQAELERHFLALDADDRRLRFGVALNDAAVRAYVARIDFERDAVFGCFDDELFLSGAAHLARGSGFAELGVSVLPGHRGRGLGGALLARAHLRARDYALKLQRAGARRLAEALRPAAASPVPGR